MRTLNKIATTLLVTIMILSSFPITADAGKPSPPPVQGIDFTANPAEFLNIPVGVPKDITITSTYSKPLNWAVATTLGTASLSKNPSVIIGGIQSTILTVSSTTAGTGTVSITATDSTNRKIKLTKSFIIQFVPISDPINNPPVAENDTASGKVGATVHVYVLANDTDIDADSLSIDSFTDVTPVTGAVVTKVGNYFDITASSAGVYTFSYSVTDGKAVSNSASVTITFSKDLVYVALGDSIPYGRYYTSFWNYLGGGTDTNSYIEQFRDAKGVLPANYFDKSVSGYKTMDVLVQLGDSIVRANIGKADVITLCVGGNEIMDAAPRTISGLDKVNVNWTVADQGRAAFEANWSQIIDGIQELNPDVTLIVMTIYNPYRSTDSNYLRVDKYFENSTDKYGLNYIIRNTKMLYNAQLSVVAGQSGADFDYRFVDIYTAFNNSPVKDSLTGFYSSFCDPHPNQNGHNLIFAEHSNIYN